MADIHSSSVSHGSGQPRHDPSLKTASFASLWDAWPVEGEKDLAKKFAGDLPVVLGTAKDTSIPDGGVISAVRLSIAFNESGHPLTASSYHSGKVIKDGSGNLIIANPAEFKLFLERKFGKGKHCKDEATASRCVGTQGGIVFFEGVKGCPHGALDLFSKDGKLRTVNSWFEDSANAYLFPLHE